MATGLNEQKKAVACGHWPLYRFDPRLSGTGKNPLQMDSKAPTLDFVEFAYGQNRFRSLTKSKPEVAEKLIELSKKDTARKQSLLNQLANLDCEC